MFGALAVAWVQRQTNQSFLELTFLHHQLPGVISRYVHNLGPYSPKTIHERGAIWQTSQYLPTPTVPSSSREADSTAEPSERAFTYVVLLDLMFEMGME